MTNDVGVPKPIFMTAHPKNFSQVLFETCTRVRSQLHLELQSDQEHGANKVEPTDKAVSES